MNLYFALNPLDVRLELASKSIKRFGPELTTFMVGLSLQKTSIIDDIFATLLSYTVILSELCKQLLAQPQIPHARKRRTRSFGYIT